jgi:hypothetical protein
MRTSDLNSTGPERPALQSGITIFVFFVAKPSCLRGHDLRGLPLQIELRCSKPDHKGHEVLFKMKAFVIFVFFVANRLRG